jgi:hypothetical protein
MKEANEGLILRPQESKNPDLIMDIKATPEQMKAFGIDIEGSKLTQSCFNTDDIDANMDDIYYGPENIFNFSGNTRPLIGNVYNFPNATSFSLSYFTPETKPRIDVPGEYRAGDYFELFIRNKDGSEVTYYLERNFLIHKK